MIFVWMIFKAIILVDLLIGWF